MADRIVLMRDGELVQVGTPAELYHRPHDLFVAQFVGAPAMNLLGGVLRRRGGEITVSLGDHDLPLDAPPCGLGAVDGRPVVVGVRPENLVPDPSGPFTASVVHHAVDGGHLVVSAVIDAPPADIAVDGDTAIDEPDAALAHLARPGRAVVRYFDDPSVVPSHWQPVSIGIDAARVHLFDAATGQAISRRSPAIVA